MRDVDDSHPLFAEVFEFASMVVANMSLLMHAAATETIRNLGTLVNEMVARRSVAVQGKVSDHAMTASIPLQSQGSNDVVTLLKTDELFAYLCGAAKKKPDRIYYAVQPVSAMPPSPPSGPERTERSGSDPTQRFALLTGYVIGGAFERHRSTIEAKYGKDPSAWPTELQFFRHLRNGCFHSNTFSIRPHKGKPQIQSANPPKWGSYVMASDASLNGQRAIGGFFHMHQTVPFLDDVGKLL
jgi:hypothetical protein